MRVPSISQNGSKNNERLKIPVLHKRNILDKMKSYLKLFKGLAKRFSSDQSVHFYPKTVLDF